MRSFSISAFFPEVKPAHAAFQSYVSKASEMDIAVSRGVADLRARPGVKGKRITELRRRILPEVWASLICLALIQLEKVAVRAGRGILQKLGWILCWAQVSRASSEVTNGSLLICTSREAPRLSLTTAGEAPGIRASLGMR